MATNYKPTSRPARPWTGAETAKFNVVRDKLKWESYPNGNSGWQDRQTAKFEDAGFAVANRSNGDPANITIVWFDVAAESAS